MNLPEIDSTKLATAAIVIISVAAMYFLKLDAKEIVIAGVSAIAGAMTQKIN